MKRFATAMLAGAAMSLAMSAHAIAEGKVIGVSWSNFQEERWQTDEAAYCVRRSRKPARGYISADAQSSASKQLTDVESLIAQGRRRAHHPGAGFLGRRPGRGERRQRGHSGHRL